MIKKAAWFVFFITMSVSCLDEPDCFSLNNNVVQISFKKPANAANVISFQEIKADGDVIYTTQNVAVINLPLNYLSDQTTYTFLYSDTLKTLTLKYLSKIQFVSDSCGQRFVLSNLSVGETDFDSVRVLSTTPFKNGTSATANFEIHRKKK